MGQLPVVCLLAVFGLYLLVRPSAMVGWVRKVYPEAPLDKSGLAVLIVRVIGAASVAFAFLILYVVVVR